MKRCFSLFLALAMLGLQSCAPSKPKVYTDPKGRFSVLPPRGWKKQIFDGPKSKVAFAKNGDVGLMIIVQEYKDGDSVSESEKERIRTSYPKMIKTKHSSETTDVVEKEIQIDGATAWSYSAHIPGKKIDTRIAALVKDGYWHTITLTCDKDTDTLWANILSSYKILTEPEVSGERN